MRGQFSRLVAIVLLGGMKENESYFPGTIFRFPLRTPQQATVSEIWKESFVWMITAASSAISEDGPQLLLFTNI